MLNKLIELLIKHGYPMIANEMIGHRYESVVRELNIQLGLDISDLDIEAVDKLFQDNSLLLEEYNDLLLDNLIDGTYETEFEDSEVKREALIVSETESPIAAETIINTVLDNGLYILLVILIALLLIISNIPDDLTKLISFLSGIVFTFSVMHIVEYIQGKRYHNENQ